MSKPQEKIARIFRGNPVTEPAPCLIIGEVAQAHDGSLGCAHAYIDAIADAGADAVKFQTHLAAEESTLREPWRVKFSRQDRTRYDYWKRMEFTPEQWAGLKQHAEKRGLLFLSSPFSQAAIDLLLDLDIVVWKVASGEITNIPLLDRMIESGLPVLLSSGMSDVAEIDRLVAYFKGRNHALALLQCTSAYPCPPEKVGLNLIPFFRERYRIPVGLSDHSGTPFPGLAAAVLDSAVLEVHITFSRQMFGPDVVASITPDELADLVTGIRFIETMRRTPLSKDDLALETAPLRDLFTKSVVARRPLEVGRILDEADLSAKKPGTGMPAEALPNLLGKRLRRAKAIDDQILPEDVEPLS